MSLKRHILPIWTVAVVAVILTSTNAHSQQPPKGEPIAEGWVQSAGEIRIYAHKSDLGKLYDGSCISGVMSDRRTMPKKFKNRHVLVYGTLIAARELHDMTLHGYSIGVENYCNSNKIAIISLLVLDEDGR
jgi:hypothetical protein